MTTHPNRSRASGPASTEPKKRGRPPVLTAEQQTRPRSVRLDDARWAKLQALGSEWLRAQIDAA